MNPHVKSLEYIRDNVVQNHSESVNILNRVIDELKQLPEKVEVKDRRAEERDLGEHEQLIAEELGLIG
jgi:hypothetical protein